MNDTPVERSIIFIEFISPGSSFFKLGVENVTPFQMLEIAAYLDFKAKFQLNLQENQALQQEQDKIIVPKPKILIKE
jgi:hypothetical protein